MVGSRVQPVGAPRNRLLAGVAGLVWLAAIGVRGGETPSFRDLFNGKDLAGWIDVNTSPETWKVEDGLLVRLGQRGVTHALRERSGAEGSNGSTAEAESTVAAVVVVDGDVLGKPRNTDDARGMLRRISGRRHTVLTGLALTAPGVVTPGTTQTRLTRVARSQSEYFPHRPFSPRWKPWSLHKTIMVLSAYFDFSSAATNWPMRSSTIAVHAR